MSSHTLVLRNGHPENNYFENELEEFMLAVQRVLSLDEDLLGLKHSHIIDNIFWIKLKNGEFLVVNPDQKTIYLGSEEMCVLHRPVWISQDSIIELTQVLYSKINQYQTTS